MLGRKEKLKVNRISHPFLMPSPQPHTQFLGSGKRKGCSRPLSPSSPTQPRLSLRGNQQPSHFQGL